MDDVCVNTLSANSQCKAPTHVKNVVGRLVDCFKYISPAIKSGRIRLLYDKTIENRSLVDGENFHRSIHDIDDSDIRTLWYIYTKNLSTIASSEEQLEVIIESDQCPRESIQGSLSKGICCDGAQWLSFGESALTEESDIYFTHDGNRNNIHNSSGLNQLLRLFPKYSASPKHSAKPYHDKERGEDVAEMPLANADAQNLLLTSVQNGSDRWAYHLPTTSYFRFKQTGVFGGVVTFHGFKVSAEELPHGVGEILLGHTP